MNSDFISNSPISLVILDLDDTLCDTRTAYTNARSKISEILAASGIDPSAFWPRYETMASGPFQQAIDGALPWPEYRRTRFLNPLEGIISKPEELAERLNIAFMDQINFEIRPFDDVIPTLQSLRAKGIRSALLTNGPSDGQRIKIQSSGLADYLDGIFISDELNCAKPDPTVFECVLKQMQTPFDETVMIGDSLESDMAGADNAGIAGILMDRFHGHADFTGHRITRLDEIHDLLPKLRWVPGRSFSLAGRRLG